MEWSTSVPVLPLSRSRHFFYVVLLTIAGATSGLAGEHQNLDEFEKALVTYHDDGTYDREIRDVAAMVIQFIRAHARHVSKPALVLDVDETSLSNWPKIRANQLAFFSSGPCDRLPDGPCGEDTWEKLGIDAPIEPTLSIYREARSLGVAVFFVTGRNEAFRHATEQNLHVAGYTDFVQVIMEPEGSHYASAADFKAPARESIEKMGFHIIANVGDQKSDISGGHADQGFQFPNPFYFIP